MKYTSEEISNLLEDYVEVTNYSELMIGNHIRYYTFINDEKHFRIGGNIKKLDGLPKYLVLSTKNLSWSVNLENSIIYKRVPLETIKDEYKQIIEFQRKKLEKYGEFIKILDAENKKLKNIINNYNRENGGQFPKIHS